MSFEITVHDGRSSVHDFPLFKSDKVTEVLMKEADIGRVKIGRAYNTSPDLDLIEGTKTTGGSGVSVTNTSTQSTIHFHYGENETLDPGTYDMEVSVVDDSVASPLVDPTLFVVIGILHILKGQGGNTGLTD
jgi:hypothetical protein